MVTDTIEDGDDSERDEYVVDFGAQKTYILGHFLGQGAHAMVYSVTDITQDPNQQFAMKVMTIDNSVDKSSRGALPKGRSREVKMSQIMKEVDIHSVMKHRNIVRLVSHFRDETRFYMVLEHCEMNNLGQVLRHCKSFSENDTRCYLKQLLAGLQHIHERGIIHRDLKPANIYITQDLVLKIGDFGLADRIGCKTRVICGTPNYISPEVLKEEGYTTAVDIWATGCITYHMITGRPPFEADNQAATYDLIRAHRYSPIPPSQAGAALRHLVNWMLAYRPQDRPSIPFIFGHAWMKRPQHRTSKTKTRGRRKDLPETIPLADLNSEDTTVSAGKDRGKKEQSFWRNVLEKAKIHSKILSYDDMSSLSVFTRMKSRRNSCSTREAIKKAIEEVLKGAPLRSDVETEEYRPLPIFISKWIDYSNKYGFGYELTDGTCGVSFADGSQMSLDRRKTCATWQKTDGRRLSFPIHSVPNHLQEKLELLNYFIEYMDSNLSSGVPDENDRASQTEFVPFLKNWTRNDKVIIFEMVHGSVQFNFFKDHSKYILLQENVQEGKQVILVTVDAEKKTKIYNLTKMGRNGCPEDLINHLIYIHSFI